jgi:putative pyrroloquinoline-quinone binding quinoprotein
MSLPPMVRSMERSARRPDRRRGVRAALIVATGFVLVVQLAVPAGAGGAQLWATRDSGPGMDSDSAASVVVSPGGSTVFATGSSGTSDGYVDLVTTAYMAASGARVWQRRFDGPDRRNDAGATALVSPDGRFLFVSGLTQGSTTDYDILAVAYDASSGHQRWIARYDGPAHGFDRSLSAALSPDGATLFVSGGSTGIGTEEDITVVAFDTATGAVRWVARYDGPGQAVDEARSVAVGPDGTAVYVTGISYGSGTRYDYATVAYSAQTGEQLWVRRYNGPIGTRDDPSAVRVGPGGGVVFVTGSSVGAPGESDFATIAYDASSGDTLWVHRYDGPGRGDDWAYAGLEVSPGGDLVFAAGYSLGAGTGDDYTVVAYSSTTGETRWVGRWSGPGNSDDIAYALAVSPGGQKVFLSGASPCCSGGDIITVAFSTSDGAQLWASRYRCCSKGQGIGYSSVVSPGGTRVFVAGTSPGSSGDGDFVTVAYAA